MRKKLNSQEKAWLEAFNKLDKINDHSQLDFIISNKDFDSEQAKEEFKAKLKKQANDKSNQKRRCVREYQQKYEVDVPSNRINIEASIDLKRQYEAELEAYNNLPAWKKEKFSKKKLEEIQNALTLFNLCPEF